MPIGVHLTSIPVTDGGLTIKLRFPLAPLISISVTPELWGVGGCGIIDFDFIIPIQPETI